MKIVHLTRSLDPSYGGTVGASMSYYENSKITGYYSHLVAISGPINTIIDSTILHGPVNGYGFSIKSLIRFYCMHKDADFIFVHGLWQFHGVMALFLSLFCGTKLVVVPHGMAAKYFDQFYWKRLKKKLYWIVIEKHIAKRCFGVIYLGEGESETVSEYFGAIASTKSEIIPITFDSARASSFSNTPKKEKVEFLFVGRNHHIKGVANFIKSLDSAILALGIEIRLTLIGDFDSTFIQNNYIANPYLELNYIGPIYGEDKYRHMASATCLVIPSYYESFGMVALEALSVGTPVLVSEFVGVGKDLEKLEYCVTYYLDSVESLIDGVKKILLIEKLDPRRLEVHFAEYNAERIQEKVAVFLRRGDANSI